MREHYVLCTLTIHLPTRSCLPTRKNLPSITSVRVLAFEVYKTLNNLNPIFRKDYILLKTTSHNLRIRNPRLIPKVKTTNYGIQSLSFQGPKNWISLPDEIKTAQNAKQFKNLIKTWFHENKPRVLYAANEVIYAILEIAFC